MWSYFLGSFCDDKHSIIAVSPLIVYRKSHIKSFIFSQLRSFFLPATAKLFLAYISSVLYLPRYICTKNETFQDVKCPREYLVKEWGEYVGTLKYIRKKGGGDDFRI